MIDQKLWQLMQASKALIEKMDEITNSPEYQRLFYMGAQYEGIEGIKRYEGEDWADEYAALKYEIEMIEMCTRDSWMNSEKGC